MEQTGLDRGGDDFYQTLMEAHEGLTLDQSTALNARLVLLLAHEVDDVARLQEVIAEAVRLEPST